VNWRTRRRNVAPEIRAKSIESSPKATEKAYAPRRKADSSDYNSYHGVRKARQKVRYLIDFFEPLLDKKRRKMLKNLKRLQKLFGALNDVVASQELLSARRASLPRCANAEHALHSLEKEQRRRSRTSVL
jgi:CHAD domain-containing protein